MNDQLKALIEKARNRRMTSAELADQAESFVYGNLHMDNPAVSRRAVRAEIDRQLAITGNAFVVVPRGFWP